MSEIMLSVSTAVMSNQSDDNKLSQAIHQSNNGQQKSATPITKSQKQFSASKPESAIQKRSSTQVENDRNHQTQLKGGGVLVNNQA